MKLGLYPVLLTVLVTLLLLLARSAEASPRRGSSSDNALEDALADGDIDEEDIATSPLSSLSAATSGRPILGRPSGSAWVSLLGFSRQAPLQGRQEIGGFVVVGLPLDRFARANTRVTTAPTAALAPALESRPRERAGTRDAPASVFDRAAVRARAHATARPLLRRGGVASGRPRCRRRAARRDRIARTMERGPAGRAPAGGANRRCAPLARHHHDHGREQPPGLDGRERRLRGAPDVAVRPAALRGRRAGLRAHPARAAGRRARIGAKVLDALFHWQRAALDLPLASAGAAGHARRGRRAAPLDGGRGRARRAHERLVRSAEHTWLPASRRSTRLRCRSAGALPAICDRA